MNSKELNKKLKENIIDNLYLFCGDEDYIKDTYIKKIKDIVLADDISGLNFIQYDELPDINDLTDTIESVPIMCEKKIILLNSLNLTGTSVKKDLKTSITELLSDLPEYTIVIIKEPAYAGKSKTSAVYKLCDKKGAAIECDLLSNSDMILFMNKHFIKNGKKITKENLELFLSLCDGTINFAVTEADKICAYLGENDIVNKCDIELMVKKPIEDKVFELFDSIVIRNKTKAYNILNDLKLLKNQHSPAQIFSIICDNFINMYLAVNNFKDGIPNSDTVRLLDLPPNRAFVVSKLLKQAKTIDITRLKRIISRLSEMDIKIKRSTVDPYYALEEIIAIF